MMTKKRFSIRERLASFRYAFHGINLLIRKEHNAWIHLAAALMVIGFGIILKLSAMEWSLIVFAIGLVFAAEAVNTAIEKLVDLVSPQHNKKAGKVKDLAAGAVLICAITAAIIGLLVLLPKIMALICHRSY
jgi:diacylglycerol kinase (ATP)